MPRQRRIEDTPVPTRFTPQELVMIEAARRAFNLPTRSAAVRYAVEFLYTAILEAPDATATD